MSVPTFPNQRLSRLTLGTAQLGMPYGLGRAAAGLSEMEAWAVLDAALAAGVRCLDTARGYGTAEARIGAWLRHTAADMVVVTKLPDLREVADADVGAAVGRAMLSSMRHLGCSVLPGCLVHKPDDVYRVSVIDALRAARDAGRILAFGASVYTVEEAQIAVRHDGLSLLQLPIHLASPQPGPAEVAEQAAEQGVTVFARSALLQGLLLRGPGDVPPHLHDATDTLGRLRGLAEDAGVSMLTLALGSVAALPGVASVVVGFDHPEQIAAAVAAVDGAPLSPELAQEARTIARGLPTTLADPRLWPKGR